MSSYKLTFNGRVATVPNWTGYVSYPQPSAKPYFIFEFSAPDFVPTSSLLNKGYIYSYTGTWKQISSSPNRWKLEMNNYSLGETVATQYGFSFLFSDKLVSNNLGGGTCKLIGSGNFDFIDEYGNICDSFDRMFEDCTGLTYIEPIHWNGVINVGGMFAGCTNVEGGALDQYNWFATYAVNITNHSGTFTNCGSNTQTGIADLAQIPVGWGGNMIPASTLMTSTRGKFKNNYDIWKITADGPDWTNMNGLYLFTEASISTYAGVSMNRTRIAKFNNLHTSPDALYFYPCFMQHTSTAITWAVTTDSPNGSLDYHQSNTDMPGTLDYSTYGAFAHEFGTYDPTGTVYFCFLVTNVPIANWAGLTDPYGVLYNSNFKTDAGLRYFF